MEYYLKTPLSPEDVLKLNAGDVVYLTGEILTARDEAHARILEMAEKGKDLPFSLEGSAVYHCGPLMKKVDEDEDEEVEVEESEEGDGLEKKGIEEENEKENEKTEVWKVVSAGPTTSGRMSKMTPPLLKAHSVRAVIGKGGMKDVTEALKESCVYLAYTGGCAALAAELIKEVKTVHWLDLGMPEAVWVLEVEKFGPLIVGIDAKGRDIFEEVREKARKVLAGAPE